MNSDRDAAIRSLWDAGRVAWPALLVPQDSFAAHLRPHLTDSEPADSVKALKAEDLYLACACALGQPAALAAFEQRHLAQLPLYLSHMNLSAAFVDDVRQQVSARLFVGEPGSPARIGSYSGRGSLSSWLRTLAVRAALNLREKKDEQLASGPREDVADRVFAVHQDPETEFLKARYAAPFRAAIRAAVAALPDDQRTVLHLYLVGGLTTTRIGALFQVSHTTVSRWLGEARAAIFKQTQALLRQQLGIDAQEFQSLVRLVQSQLDVSLGGALGDGKAQPPDR